MGVTLQMEGRNIKHGGVLDNILRGAWYSSDWVKTPL